MAALSDNCLSALLLSCFGLANPLYNYNSPYYGLALLLESRFYKFGCSGCF